MSSILHLLLGNVHGSSVISCHHQLLEPNGTWDVATLAYVQEWHAQMVVDVVYHQVLQTWQPHLWSTHVGKLARLKLLRHLTNCLDVSRRRPTAATNHIQPAILKEHLVLSSHIIRGIIVSAHSIRQTSVRVHVQETLNNLRELLNKWSHVLGTKGAVQSYTHRLGVTDGSIKGLPCLTWQCTAGLIYQRTWHKHGDIQPCELQVFSNGI